MLKILDSITTRILPEHHLGQSPRWMLDGRTVIIGPYHSSAEHEQHLAQTVGSTDWLWSSSDELRFDQKTLLLQSVLLLLPDATLPSDLSLVPWLMASQETGLLQLSTSQNFQLPSSSFRWLVPEGQILMCVHKRATEDAQYRLRLRIAANLELFFADKLLCGWALLNPAHFIVDAWEEPSSEGTDPSFTSLIKEYLALVTDPYIEQMEDQDPKLLGQLLGLYTRAGLDSSSPQKRAILRAAIADKLDRFYGHEVN